MSVHKSVYLPLSLFLPFSLCLSPPLTPHTCIQIALSFPITKSLSVRRRGIWNVPYLTGVYVIQRAVLINPETRPNYIHKLLDADMAMAANMREKVCCPWCLGRA